MRGILNYRFMWGFLKRRKEKETIADAKQSIKDVKEEAVFIEDKEGQENVTKEINKEEDKTDEILRKTLQVLVEMSSKRKVSKILHIHRKTLDNILGGEKIPLQVRKKLLRFADGNIDEIYFKQMRKNLRSQDEGEE